MKTLVSAGELRVELLDLLDAVSPLEVLVSPPGVLPGRYEGQSELASAPGRLLSASQQQAWRDRLLGAFAEQLDRLPQSVENEALLHRWLGRLRDGDAQVRGALRQPGFTRAISRPDATLLTAGPIGLTLDEPQFALTGAAHQQVRQWCEARLADATDLSPEVLGVIRDSWAGDAISPEDLYYKVLYEYFAATLHALDRETDPNPMLEWLTEFQKEAYHFAKGILRRFGGVFLADVVGLGKTWIAMALLRHLAERYDRHAVVIAPPSVLPAWEDLAREHRVSLAMVSLGKLSDLDRHRDREVLVVDESHNFRNLKTSRHQTIQRWLRPDGQPSSRQVLLLSATPQNNRPEDVLHQLGFFPDNYAALPYQGESLEDWFRTSGSRPDELAGLLQHVVVRRTRGFIREAWPEARLKRRLADGSVQEVPLVFPERVSGPDQILRYRLDGRADGGLYDHILTQLAAMRFPLHGLGLYLRDEDKDRAEVQGLRRAGQGVRGLYKVLLLKRLESSLTAFYQSVLRLKGKLDAAIEAYHQGKVLIHDDEVTDAEGEDEVDASWENRLPLRWFNKEDLGRALIHDHRAVSELLLRVEGLLLRADPKVERLRQWFAARLPKNHRTIVFTQFADTAEYLGKVLGTAYGATEVVSGRSGSRRTILRRFAPLAHREEVPRDEQIDLLISTDALSEGVNLQDADTLINYDLHWNPVRLIQRAGRIDRIGSPNDQILVASFLPEKGLEEKLGLEAVLRRRIDEFLRVFGEDSRVLPEEEIPDAEEMRSAYTGEALERADEVDDIDALSRHANRILALRRSDPERFESIEDLRPGRRAVSRGTGSPVVITRAGWLWQFWQGAEGGEVVPLDVLQGMERLYRHAQAGVGPLQEPVAVASWVESAREAFSLTAEEVRAQRERPRLSKVEDWVREQLRAYRDLCSASRRPLVDELTRWVDAGQASALLQRRARRWRGTSLPPVSVFDEVRVLAGRFPLNEEPLGEVEVTGVVVGRP
ncbi:MAG: hypothetical protein JXX28_05755 [Deltaproteobacteria bacterium]|nr:hypothetical protein [Deltaproteobacteria bacterium]